MPLSASVPMSRFLLQFGMRPLHMAAWYGHQEAVKMLINAGANVSAVNKVRVIIIQTMYKLSKTIITKDTVHWQYIFI